jgi:hypothetical protein
MKFFKILEIVDSEKLRRSLMKSGANSAVVDTILSQIEKEIYGGITTKKFIKGFSLLKSNLILMRQDSAICALATGTTRFLLRKYIARLFLAEGCEAKQI